MPAISPSDSPVQLTHKRSCNTSQQAMGRKRNRGKARKAAKAKAREEEENRERALIEQQLLQAISEDEKQFEIQKQKSIPSPKSPPSDLQCKHGAPPSSNDIVFQFSLGFQAAYNEACDRGSNDVGECLAKARNASMDEFADVWHDTAMMEMATSCYLRRGANAICADEYGHAQLCATFARFFEQHIAVELKQSQAVPKWPKIGETHSMQICTR